ncbi:MAG: hypothetical protein JWL69_2273 [Phycisphaerales bacterium]|nr:hypothetical protein [Phycisphaerales bacterium]
MLRHLFTLLSALSLLLCIATTTLWVRSYRYVSYWDSHRYWNTDGRGHRDEFWAISYHGGLCYSHSLLWTEDYWAIRGFSPSQNGRRFDGNGEKWKGRSASNGFVHRTYAGFGYERWDSVKAGDLKVTGTIWAIAVPYWSVAALFAVPPAGWLLAFRRARSAGWRLRHMRCFRCGYDLRATPERCPECGEIPAGATP